MDYLSLWKDKIVYHVTHSDLDGISCRILSEYYLKPIVKEINFLCTGDYNFSDFSFELANKSDYIIFTDIAPNLELYNKINKNKNIFIFDHHQSSRENLGDLDQYVFDLNRSGNKIFYDELLKGKRRKPVIDQYIYLADTYDLWKLDSPDWENGKNLHNVMFGYVNWSMYDQQTDTTRHENFIDIQLKKFDKSDSFFFTNYEKNIIKRGYQIEEKALQQAKKNLQIRVDGEGNSYAFTLIDSRISVIANKILRELEDKVKYIVVHSFWSVKNKGTYDLSLRSLGDFDVRYIAEKHAGGGHKNSAGISFSNIDTFEKFKKGEIHLL